MDADGFDAMIVIICQDRFIRHQFLNIDQDLGMRNLVIGILFALAPVLSMQRLVLTSYDREALWKHLHSTH